MSKPSQEIIARASEHVQRNARYYPDAPDKRYAVQYPKHSATVFFSDDTWDLVEQLARHLAEKQTEQS